MRFQPANLRSRVVAAGKEVHEDESGAMMIIGLFFALFLVGALIMCYNLWMTVRAQPQRVAQHSAVPAE